MHLVLSRRHKGAVLCRSTVKLNTWYIQCIMLAHTNLKFFSSMCTQNKLSHYKHFTFITPFFSKFFFYNCQEEILSLALQSTKLPSYISCPVQIQLKYSKGKYKSVHCWKPCCQLFQEMTIWYRKNCQLNHTWKKSVVHLKDWTATV